MAFSFNSQGGFVDGFDHYVTADIGKKYNLVGSGYAIVGGRSGNGLFLPLGAAVNVNNGSGGGPATFAFFCARDWDGADRALIWVGQGTTQQFRVMWKATGELELYDETDTLVATSSNAATGIGNFYHFEIRYAGTGNQVVISVDGTTFISHSNANVGGIGSNAFTLAGLGATTAQGGTIPYLYFDDLVVIRTTGSSLPTLRGPMEVITAYPISDATPNAMSPSTGTDHFAVVDESPIDVSDYLTATAGSQDELFNFTSMTDDGRQVLAASITATLQKSGSIDFRSLAKLPTTAVNQIFFPVPTLSTKIVEGILSGTDSISTFNGYKFGVRSV